MSCCRRCRRSESTSEVEAIRNEMDGDELESFRDSRCFMVIWRDRNGRRRCKCCCRRSE